MLDEDEGGISVLRGGGKWWSFLKIVCYYIYSATTSVFGGFMYVYIYIYIPYNFLTKLKIIYTFLLFF